MPPARLLLGSPALLQGPRNSSLTISVPEPSGRPVGLWGKYWFIYSVSSKARSPGCWCTNLETWPWAGDSPRGWAGLGRSFLAALRHIPGDSHTVLHPQKVKPSKISVKPAIFSCVCQPHPRRHFPGGQISQEALLCQGEKTRKPSHCAVVPATCDGLNDRAKGTLQMDEGRTSA